MHWCAMFTTLFRQGKTLIISSNELNFTDKYTPLYYQQKFVANIYLISDITNWMYTICKTIWSKATPTPQSFPCIQLHLNIINTSTSKHTQYFYHHRCTFFYTVQISLLSTSAQTSVIFFIQHKNKQMCLRETKSSNIQITRLKTWSGAKCDTTMLSVQITRSK